MFYKKELSIFFIFIFTLSIFLTQFAFAQTTSEITIISDLSQIEMQVFGEVKTESILSRVEYLEKEMVGRTLPGIIKDRVKQLKDFILTGTPEEPSLAFKINSVQLSLMDSVTEDPLLAKVEELEINIFGEVSDDVLAMRAEKIFNVIFEDGRPSTTELTIPAGTLVPVVLMDDIGSKKSEDGDIFEYQIAEDVIYSGINLIPKGTTGKGEVLKARKASVFLRKGKLELDFRFIEAIDNTPLRLVMGEKAEAENSRIGLAFGASIAGLIILSNPIGLVAGALIPGKNITLEEGTKIFLEVAGDTKISTLAY